MGDVRMKKIKELLQEYEGIELNDEIDAEVMEMEYCED